MVGPDLAASNVYFTYGKMPLFKGLSVEFKSKLGLLVGPSGCGKTTLLKILGGFMYRGDLRATSIYNPMTTAMILQKDVLVPWMSARSNMEMFLKKPISELRSHPLYSMVEFLVSTPVYTLSFGQRRMLELFRIFASDRELLLLDEPLNYLDAPRRRRIVEYMINQTSKRVICTSHYFEEFGGPEWETYRFVGDPPYTELEH